MDKLIVAILDYSRIGRIKVEMEPVDVREVLEVNASCLFTVPHDQSGPRAVDNGPSAGYTVHAP